MSDERFDEWLKDAARGYNAPPESVPRDAMWDAVAGARRDAARSATTEGHPGRKAQRRSWWSVALAAGVLLTAGIGIGYWARGTAAPVPTPAVASAGDSTGVESYDVAAAQHLSAAEALLTSYRATAADSVDQDVRRWARDLLSTTRLMLDSPAATDPRRHQLLEDLELVLAQIVQLPADAPASDRESISRTIASEHVLTRIRTSIPAGLPAGT